MPATNFPGGLTAGGVAVPTSASAAKIVSGELAFDGSNPTPLATGLTTVAAVAVCLKGNAAPGDNTSVITYDVSGGTVNFYAWKNTGGTDPTLVASTGTETFGYVITGS